MNSERAVESGKQPDFVAFIQRTLFLLGVVVIAWVLYSARQVVVMGLTAVVLAVVLGGLSTVLSRLLPWQHRKWGYRLALIIVILCVAAVLYGLWMSLGTRVAGDLGTLQGELPKAVDRLKEYPLFKSLVSAESEKNGGLPHLFTVVSSTALSMASGLLAVVGTTVLILLTAVFLAADPPLYRNAIVSVFPVSMRPRASLVLDACARGLWRWLLGQAFAMGLICLFTTAGLYLIRMEYALTLGLIAGLLQFIPYLGPYLSAIPAVMVAVTVSPGMVLSVIVLYLIVHLVESNLITPFVLENRADLPPAFTLFSTIVFGVVFGPLGVVVATPLSVLLLVLYEELYQKDVLGLEIRSAGAEGDIRARFKRGLEQGLAGSKANTPVARRPQDR